MRVCISNISVTDPKALKYINTGDVYVTHDGTEFVLKEFIDMALADGSRGMRVSCYHTKCPTNPKVVGTNVILGVLHFKENQYICPQTCNISTRKEEGKMSNTSAQGQSIVQVSQEELADAVWRTATKKAVAVAKGLLISAAVKANQDGVVTALKSEFGDLITVVIIGGSPLLVKQLNFDPRINRLVKEMRILGFEFLTDKVADLVIEPVTLALKAGLDSLPTIPAEDAK